MTFGWSQKHFKSLRDVQEQHKYVVKAARRDPDKTLFLYTDGSDANWTAVVTQREPFELYNQTSKRTHEPLTFLGGAFSSTQQHWSTYEKEAIEIVDSFRKIDYTLACDGSTVVFTDRRNLLFVSPPLQSNEIWDITSSSRRYFGRCN